MSISNIISKQLFKKYRSKGKTTEITEQYVPAICTTGHSTKYSKSGKQTSKQGFCYSQDKAVNMFLVHNLLSFSQ